MHAAMPVLLAVAVISLLLNQPAFAQADSASPPPADTSPLVTEGIINAPPADVWQVFSTPEGYKKMGVALCDMDFRIGGTIRAHYDPNGTLGDDGTIRHEILAYEPHRMLAFRLRQAPANFPFPKETWSKTWATVELTDLGDGRTHLRMVGLGYDDTAESQAMRQFFERGNAWVLQYLQKQFDKDAAGPTHAPHAADPLAPVTHTRVVNLPREEVWRLLSTADGWRQFMDAEANIELRPGGPFEPLFVKDAPAGQRGAEGCTVLSYIPGELLSFTWNAPPKFAHARGRHTWVVIRLESPSPGRTRVRLDHLGFAEQAAENADQREEWEQVRAYFQRAWGSVLDQLAQQSPQQAAS